MTEENKIESTTDMKEVDKTAQKMITEITPEQEARMPEFVERGIRIGLSTEKIDPAIALRFSTWLYKLLEQPKVPVVIVGGPTHMHYLAHYLRQHPEAIPTEECSYVSPTVMEEALKNKPDSDFVWPYLDGQFWSSWFAGYDYYREVLGVVLPETYDHLKDVQELGSVYPLDTVCIVMERMQVCNRNAAGQLHCDGGPAVSYPDGSKMWFLNGVDVSQELAETPHHKLDPKGFAAIRNAEVRREFVRKVGIERICSEIETRSLDKSKDGVYELVSVNLGGTTGFWPYLKMLNPSIGVWHMEAVSKECQTVQAALEFRNNSNLQPEVLT